MSKPNGGVAFPSKWTVSDGHNATQHVQTGMSLRDWFAEPSPQPATCRLDTLVAASRRRPHRQRVLRGRRRDDRGTRP